MRARIFKLRTRFGLTLFSGLIVGCSKPPTFVPQPYTSKELLSPGDASPREGMTHRQVLEKIFAPQPSCDAGRDLRAPALIRRLTRDEYQNTIRDLFQFTSDLREFIPADEQVLGFRNNSSLNLVSVDHAVAYSRSAGRIADQVLDKKWKDLASCSFEQEGRACIEQFLRDRLLQIWRRPAREEEIQDLLKLYDVGAALSPREGAKLLIRSLLSAPAFLYRTELGKTGQLDAYEWASALSYFFWASTPDAQLLARAADGSLLQDEVLSAEIQRLLTDPKARDGVKAFAESWLAYSQVLAVNKDGNKFPDFTSQIRVLLAQETEDTFDALVRKQGADFKSLMLLDTSLGNEALATYYGVPLEKDADGNTLLKFQGQGRRGIWGQASVLASLSYAHETHPIKRAVFIRQHLLCEELVPPPPTLNIQPPPPREGASTRERFAAHSSVGACKGCHVRIDGIGFGIEDFDPIGRQRTVDNGRPVDASGQAYDIDQQTQNFQGQAQLSEILARSTRAQRCFALQWYRMAHGRIEQEADICAIRELGDRMQSGLSVRDLMIQTITHPSYRQRRF